MDFIQVVKYVVQKKVNNIGKKNKDKIKKWFKNNKEYVKKWYEENKKENPWYSHYGNAKQRCINSKCKDYKYYGGRGIKFLLTMEEVRKLWFRDKAYLLKQPSIDREDNDGNYEYNNCKFIELSENSKKSNKERKIQCSKLNS